MNGVGDKVILEGEFELSDGGEVVYRGILFTDGFKGLLTNDALLALWGLPNANIYEISRIHTGNGDLYGAYYAIVARGSRITNEWLELYLQRVSKVLKKKGDYFKILDQALEEAAS